MVLLAFGAGGVWALTAPLSGAVVATGTIAAESGRKVVEHPDGGEVKELLVRDGDRVDAGQLLLRLDPTEARAKFEAARQAVDAALIRRARLRAERDGREQMRVPDALAERQDVTTVRQGLADARPSPVA
ncbi:MAG: biotin/lipoyl-binding protein [Rhodovibrio sp.]|nr:biotin/lipoyl-binding protein [Rhodovibrio sp.]